MKKKILLITLMVALFVCLFVISANAAQISGYQQFEVELLDGSVITVYESVGWDDPYQGRLTFTDNTYTEPPLDTEKTYPKLDWSQVVVADFTNGHRNQLNTATGEYEVKYGTNNGFSMHLNAKSFTKANATNLKTIKTGNATYVRGAEVLGRFPALEEIIFGENLEGIDWGAFINNKKLTNLDFSACTNLTTFNFSVFQGCTSLENVVLPNTLTSIGANVFNGCTSLKTVVLSTALTSIPANTFTGCTSLETVSFVGTPSEALKTAVSAAAPNVAITSITACEAYGHSNMTSLNDCVERCGICQEIVNKANPKHINISVVTYANGYASKGTIIESCQNEGCKYKITSEMPALFENKGFSAAEYEGGGMSIGFKVDKKAIEKYEEITGETVNYGVFAVLAEVIETNDIFDADGKALDGVIAADITGTDFDIFNLKIVGFTDKQVDIDLAMGAYVGTSKDGTTEYAYLQDVTTEKNDKYYFASYNDVKAILDAKNEVSAQ